MKNKIYCDGAATIKKIGNEYVREAGGWAFWFKNGDINEIHYGGEPLTTNNRMELYAIFSSIKYAFDNGISNLEIRTDSAYSLNIYTNWIYSWEKNGWTRGKKHEPIENLELIKSTWELIKSYKNKFGEINFIKVKGHSGESGNELVDTYAVKGKNKARELNSIYKDFLSFKEEI